MSPRYSFTQPICPECYARRYPDRQPAALTVSEWEECCDCGSATYAGIYLRVDPATVAHPTLLKEN